MECAAMDRISGIELSKSVTKLSQLIASIRQQREYTLSCSATCKASKKTKAEYSKIGKRVFDSSIEIGLLNVFAKIENKRYFYKALAAAKYYLYEDKFFEHLNELIATTPTVTKSSDLDSICDKSEIFFNCLKDMREVLSRKFQGSQSKKKSKRLALAGLPKNWMLDLATRAKESKYYTEILISALTGCRPAELKNGVRVSRFFDEACNSDCIAFDIITAKHKDQSAQHVRRLVFSLNNPDELLGLLINQFEYELIDDENSFTSFISSEINFTVAIRRLGEELWPKHHASITAYCFRHQFAANLKKNGSSEFISAALGHTSEKTKKNYGLANQSRGGAVPLRIEESCNSELLRTIHNEYHTDYDCLNFIP